MKNGLTIWLTGLSGSGKTTLSNALALYFRENNIGYVLVDGDVIRQHFSKGLTYTTADRFENILRIGQISELLNKEGITSIVSAISPYKQARQQASECIENFVEVFVDCPFHICEMRDVKGLYKKARLGVIKNFTGIDDPYDVPEAPHVVCRTNEETVEKSVKKIVEYLTNNYSLFEEN